MDTSIRRYLWRNFRDKAYRDRYVEANIRNALALQIRTMREDRKWTQSELGERAGMAQERISRLEDLDYGSPSLSTVKRLALAFDVGLLVRYVPFSELVNWTLRSSHEGFSVPSFDDDQISEEASSMLSSASTGAYVELSETQIHADRATGGAIAYFQEHERNTALPESSYQYGRATSQYAQAAEE